MFMGDRCLATMVSSVSLLLVAGYNYSRKLKNMCVKGGADLSEEII